jgi:hypothetical protein
LWCAKISARDTFLELKGKWSEATPLNFPIDIRWKNHYINGGDLNEKE